MGVIGPISALSSTIAAARRFIAVHYKASIRRRPCRFPRKARIISRFPGRRSSAGSALLKDDAMTTYSPKATETARLLRGKHKPTFAPHIDSGDHVVIVNAAKVVLTKNKAANKGVYRHTGYPGGIKSETYQHLLERDAAEAVRRSVRGMLPHG